MSRHHPHRRWFRRPPATARPRPGDRSVARHGDQLPAATHVARGLR